MFFFQKIKELWALPQEENDIETYNEIDAGIYFRSHNLWLLCLAMLIACVGLNADSIAAVIGAMLISPLMGPIVGLSFGLSIQRSKLIKTSLYNWILMVIVSLLASSLYFLISPFSYTTNQLNSFTEGTIFDVLLAFFGGMAGFIGIIRHEAIKVIAGVAVATSCIPPLCTAGFGLANLQKEYFFGGLYFYFINCFFIGLGTFILAILLGYPKRFFTSKRNKYQYWILILALITISPSIWMSIKRWQTKSLELEAQNYIDIIHDKYPELIIIKHSVEQQEKQKYISILLLNDSTSLNPETLAEVNALHQKLEIKWHFTPNTSKQLKQLEDRIKKLEQK